VAHVKEPNKYEALSANPNTTTQKIIIISLVKNSKIHFRPLKTQLEARKRLLEQRSCPVI
jgi:hypothetical protein